MRAVDALMECLKAEGVEVVFGLPGGANLPTYDAFYDAGIRHILVRHEAGGGHAAEGYAKATGRVGVALATSGPGATNLVTPICDAMMDSVPVVFVTGQVRTELLGTDGFQEADTIGITMPVVKHIFLIHHPLNAGTARLGGRKRGHWTRWDQLCLYHRLGDAPLFQFLLLTLLSALLLPILVAIPQRGRESEVRGSPKLNR